MPVIGLLSTVSPDANAIRLRAFREGLRTLEPGMAQGRIFQDAWNLLFFGVTAIVIALTLNIRNNAWGYWINLGVLTLADTA